jgi:hypothetical protein
MTNVVDVFAAEAPRRPAVDEAVSRLQGIRATLVDLAEADTTSLRNPAQMTLALCRLSAANRCIRVVLNDFRGSPNAEQMIRHSEALLGWIDLVHTKVADLEQTTGRRA